MYHKQNKFYGQISYLKSYGEKLQFLVKFRQEFKTQNIFASEAILDDFESV